MEKDCEGNTTILIEYNKNCITISNHAQPIVCSSVSTASYLLVTLLQKYDEKCVSFVDDGKKMSININYYDNFIELIVDNFINFAKELQKRYKNDVKMIRKR